MSAALLAYLDQLDEAHEEWSTNGLDVDTTNGEVWNTLFRRPRWMSGAEVHEIVAEHNALPKLTAALRAVFDRHEPAMASRPGAGLVCTYCSEPTPNGHLVSYPCDEVAAITTALGGAA